MKHCSINSLVFTTLLAVVCCLFTLSPHAAAQQAAQRFRAVSYNVENLFDTLHDSAYAVPVSPTTGRPTRDVLHVAGELPTGDTLDVFVCHMPSRLGHNASYRTAVARRLRTLADSVLAQRARGLGLLMGDFNDEYRDQSICRGPGAVAAKSLQSLAASPAKSSRRRAASDAAWFVLSADLQVGDSIRGTYKYRGAWNELDQIIVSRSLLDAAAPFHCSATSCRIFAPAFLLEADASRGGVKPRRTFLGSVYHGGFSDHLPLIVDFEMQRDANP